MKLGMILFKLMMLNGSSGKSYNNRFYAGKDMSSASSLTTTMDQFIEKYGPRVPDHVDSQKNLRPLCSDIRGPTNERSG